jgi:hypothetical protein
MWLLAYGEPDMNNDDAPTFWRSSFPNKSIIITQLV